MSDNSFPVANTGGNQQEPSTALVDPNATGGAQPQAGVQAEAAFADGDDDNRIGGTVGSTMSTQPPANNFKGRVNEFVHNGEILRKLIILGFLVLFVTGAIFGLLSLQSSNEAASQRTLGRYTDEEIGPVLDFLSLQGFNYTLRGDSISVPMEDYEKVREAMLRNNIAVHKIAEQDAIIDNRNPTAAGEVPSRFYYPTDEQALNQENYQAAVDRHGGTDDINTPLWWE